MAQAGVAYVEIRPDWAGFNREVKRQVPSLDRQFTQMGGHLSGELARSFSSAGRQAGALFTKGASVGIKAGAVGIGAAIVYSVKKAADFEQQLSSLGSVSNASARQMDALRKSAIKAGAETKFSALDAAKAQTELAKGGLSTSQILKGGLSSALALAAAGELDLSDAAATTVNSMKLFRIQGRDSIKVADALATAANSTTADVSDFAIALNQAGSAAKTVGLTFPETVTALEALAEVGIKGSDAGTSLKTALVQLASPASLKAVNTAKELGIQVFDAHGNIKSLVDVSKELRSGLGGLSKEQRIAAATTLVGQDGFRALLALYDAGPKKIAKLEGELNKQGTAADVARKKQDNLKGALEQLGGSVETLGIQVGTAMLPGIRKGTDQLTNFTNDISKIASDDKLDFGEKLSKAINLAEIRIDPWIDKLKAQIVKADIPGEIGDLLSLGSDKIAGGIDTSPFVDKLLSQVEDADLPDKIGELVSAAAPKIAHAAAGVGVIAAESFAKAFVSADGWGKLVLGGWLLSKMGGVKSFRALGATAWTSFDKGATGAQVAASASGARGAAATSARRGTAAAVESGLVAGSPLGLAGGTQGLTHGNPVNQTTKPGLTAPSRAQRATTAARGAGGALQSGLGKLPLVAAVTVPFFELAAEKRADADEKASQAFKRAHDALEQAIPDPQKWQDTSDAIAFLGHTLDTSRSDFGGVTQALKDLGLSIDSKPREIGEAKKALEGLQDRFAVTQRLFAKGISLPSQVTVGDAEKVADAIDRMATGASGSIRALRTNVRLNTKLIKSALGDDTLAGKEALAANFRAAAENVKNSMDAAGKTTKAGTAEIRRLLILSLGQFGFSEKQALNIIKTGDDQGNAGREGGAQRAISRKQSGGMLISGGHATVPGAGSGDKVHLQAMVEPGEKVFVLNRNASAQLGQLQALNSAVPRFQAGGLLALASGGQVTGDTDFLPALMKALQAMSRAAGIPIFVQSGRRTVAEQLAQGPSTPGHPVAGPNGPHVRGIAGDITPGYDAFGKIAARFGLGFTVMPQEPWHIQLLDAAASALAEAPELKRLLVGGPDSPLKSIVQGGFDALRGAAQQVLSTAVGSTANGSEASVPSGSATGNGAGLMRQISKQHGWNFADWWALDATETGHGTNLTNPTSTARLRGQFLDSNYGKYGPGSDPSENPSMAQQIYAMADYIADRYGDPSKALAFHKVHNFYQRGGLLDGLGTIPTLGSVVAAKLAPQKGRLPAGIDLSKALGHIKAGKTEKLRDAATDALLKSVSGIGFTAQANELARLAGNADLYGEYADRSARLTDSTKIQDALQAELTRRQGLTPAPSPLFPDAAQQVIVDGLLGRVNGSTQLDWLTQQLTSLFDWRNVITDTDPLVTQLRDDTAQLLRDAQAKLEEIAAKVKKAETEIARLTKERDHAAKHEDTLADKIKNELDKPAKKRDQGKLAAWRKDLGETHTKHVDLNAKLAKLRGEKRGNEGLSAELSDKVIPALTDKRDSLEDSHGDLLGQLVDIQGLGGPSKRLAALPALGALGGKLFDVQSLMQDLTDHPPRIEATVPDTSQNDQQTKEILAGLLNEANLRTTVAERAFDVIKNFPALPFGGSFKDGGIVPGPVGAPTMILAHGGEEVTPVGGAGPRVRVVMEDHRTRVFVDDVEQIVERVTRRQARTGARGLPGRGGGVIRT